MEAQNLNHWTSRSPCFLFCFSTSVWKSKCHCGKSFGKLHTLNHVKAFNPAPWAFILKKWKPRSTKKTYMDVRANPNALQWVNGYTSWYSPPRETLLSGEKEWAVDTWNSSDGSQGIHNEWKKRKTDSKGYILYDSIYITVSKWEQIDGCWRMR